jgi:hypothetical protein
MEKKYTLLRFLGTISKILGIITAIITVLGAIGACAGAFVGSGVVGPYLDQIGLGFGQGQYVQMAVGIVTSVMTVLYGGAITIALLAVGQGVQLMTDVEKNTRTLMTMMQG